MGEQTMCIKCTAPIIYNPILGVTPYCEDCKSTLIPFKTKVPEFTSEEIKEARKMYKEDVIQSHNKGELSREWLESRYGSEDRARKQGFSDKEIKNAKYVWNDNGYYKKY